MADTNEEFRKDILSLLEQNKKENDEFREEIRTTLDGFKSEKPTEKKEEQKEGLLCKCEIVLQEGIPPQDLQKKVTSIAPEVKAIMVKHGILHLHAELIKVPQQ